MEGTPISSRTTDPTDPRYAPLYSFVEVARYARVKVSTLRSWAGAEERQPLIEPADPQSSLAPFSFLNLIEAHILQGLRKAHNIPLSEIRTAIRHLQKTRGLSHPLVEMELETDGFHLFIRELERLECVSENGQLALRTIMDRYLRRIERDENRLPIRFYPFSVESDAADAPKQVVMDPHLAFGRPVIVGTRLCTAAIYERWSAGDDLEEMAQDYAVTLKQLQEALRCETERRAA